MGSYAGVDWAADKHDVLVADEAGEELLAATFAHDEPGLRALCRTLVRLEVELVAIERPDGLLVERLLDAGLRVLALHPNQVAATRARFRVSGGKSDRFDAFVLCELARTDHHRFRVLELDADETKSLRALTARIKTLDRQIEDAVRAHPDGEIFISLFKDPNSFLTAAEMLAEIGDCRGRYPARDALAGDAGQAAVAIESGKRKTACFRWGCNKRLRSAFSRLADTTRHWHPWAADLYAAALARARHPAARRAAPGAASSGAAGRTEPRTTPPATAH